MIRSFLLMLLAAPLLASCLVGAAVGAAGAVVGAAVGAVHVQPDAAGGAGLGDRLQGVDGAGGG